MGTYNFTYHYSQPDDYHFSLDSIQFAEFIADELKEKPNLEKFSVLDLCAGCGVIGFELNFHLPQLWAIDFLEVQSIYREHFYKNLNLVKDKNFTANWIENNYNILLKDDYKNKYDLIISNPPYFIEHHGTLSPSDFKNRCRFFLDSSYENFILSMTHALKTTGVCYFLQRDLTVHKINLFQRLLNILPMNFDATIVKELRSVQIIHLKHK